MVNSQPTKNAKPNNGNNGNGNANKKPAINGNASKPNGKPNGNGNGNGNANANKKPNGNGNKPANNLNNNAKKLRELAVKLATNAIEKARQQMPNNA